MNSKIIKYRFSELQRKNLLESNWWEKNAKDIYDQKEELQEICKNITT